MEGKPDPQLALGVGPMLTDLDFHGHFDVFEDTSRREGRNQFVFVIAMCASWAVNAWRYR